MDAGEAVCRGNKVKVLIFANSRGGQICAKIIIIIALLKKKKNCAF